MEQQQEKLSDELALKRTGLADTRTGLAFKRNIMAAKRTLMAWTRTGLSMIGFGFTIYKFLQALQDEGNQLNVHPAHWIIFVIPRYFFVACGSNSVLVYFAGFARFTADSFDNRKGKHFLNNIFSARKRNILYRELVLKQILSTT